MLSHNSSAALGEERLSYRAQLFTIPFSILSSSSFTLCLSSYSLPNPISLSAILHFSQTQDVSRKRNGCPLLRKISPRNNISLVCGQHARELIVHHSGNKITLFWNMLCEVFVAFQTTLLHPSAHMYALNVFLLELSYYNPFSSQLVTYAEDAQGMQKAPSHPLVRFRHRTSAMCG